MRTSGCDSFSSRGWWASPPEQAAILAVPAVPRALATLHLEAIDRARENALVPAAINVSERRLQPLPQHSGGSLHHLDPLSENCGALTVLHRVTHGYPFKTSCALVSALDDA